MNDLFTEVLVQKQQTFLNYFVRIILILITVLFFLSGLILHPLFGLAGLGMIFLDMWLIPRQKVEYEYSYVNGELDIDEIFSKKSRKHLATYRAQDMEVFAPAKSVHMDDFKNLPVVDYTSGIPSDREAAWAFVTAAGGKKAKVLFSPNDSIVKDIRMRAPSRSFMN